MKAIKKAYGDMRWEDTPLSYSYHDEISNAKTICRIHTTLLVAGGQVQYNNIASQGDRVALGECIFNMQEGVKEIFVKLNTTIKEIKAKYGVRV